MDCGVGLPTNLAGVTGAGVIAWAQRAEALGFSALSATDRLAGQTWEPVVALAVAAGVTRSIRLQTNVIVAPTRRSGVLAKQLATLQHASDGRLVVGLGAGNRDDDFALAPAAIDDRYRALDETLIRIRSIWSGEDRSFPAFGPRPQAGGPPLLIGGRSRPTFQRAARYGVGWTAGFSAPEQVQIGIDGLREAWQAAGRRDAPAVAALTYFGLGENARERTRDYLRRYYAVLGAEFADHAATATPTDAQALLASVEAYADAGVDVLLFLPTSPDIAQLDLLADALPACRGLTGNTP